MFWICNVEALLKRTRLTELNMIVVKKPRSYSISVDQGSNLLGLSTTQIVHRTRLKTKLDCNEKAKELFDIWI